MRTPFKPGRIFVDQAVASDPSTRRILNLFPKTGVEILEDPAALKKPLAMSAAKKGLLLARHKSDHLLKDFTAMTTSAKRPYYSLNIISNCHLECSYCILQSYLANNPVITVYTNVEEILGKLENDLSQIPEESIVSTGQIADSLALEWLTGWSAVLIPWMGRQKKFFLELKTKSDCVEEILNLDHQGRTIVSWSMNPSAIAEKEELKTASVAQRLSGAKRCTDAGYRVGFHFDPMIFHENWEKNYAGLLETIFDTIPSQSIAWISAGALRFPKRQEAIMRRRFPKSKTIFNSLEQTHLPYLTYPKTLRKKMGGLVENFVKRKSPQTDFYFCMENG